MKKKLLLLTLFSATFFTVRAQDTAKTDPPLTISGSVDTYFKYDFAQRQNIGTSFASDQNSISIGMVDIALKKKVGKASFIGEIAFGPRGQEQSIPTGLGGESYHIQNLYVSYDVTDKLALTAGYMGTFVGYEVISPVGNFNYSTSYLFTNGPFQNAGFKAAYAFSDKVSLMAGIFNDNWNTYTANARTTEDGTEGEVSTFGAQLMVAPVTGWSAYVNFLTGPYSGTIIDLTTAYQITDAFKLGLNAADYSKPHDMGGYQGIALYPQYAFSSAVALGLRGEYFKTKDVGAAKGSNVKAFTLTANIKAGPLTFIPEVRLDNNSFEGFVDEDGNHGFFKKNGDPTKTASQFVLAAVYAF